MSLRIFWLNKGTSQLHQQYQFAINIYRRNIEMMRYQFLPNSAQFIYSYYIIRNNRFVLPTHRQLKFIQNKYKTTNAQDEA